MSEQDKNSDLDNLLDSLLASYSDAQPRPGLETRIMAQLRTETARKKSNRWSLSWMWTGAAATILALAVVLMIYREPVVAPPPPLVLPADWSLLNNSGSAFARPSHITVATRRPIKEQRREKMAVAADTRPDVFPTPAPLSDQEKLLLRYLARTPRNEIAAQSHADEPTETAEPLLLQIQPPTRTEFNRSTR